MAAPRFVVAPGSLVHPDEPEFMYEFAYQDCLAIISASRNGVSDYIASILRGEVAVLPLRVEAIGAFTGKTLFEHMDRDDFYDAPHPFRTGVFEQHEDLNIPFHEKAGVVCPDENDIWATYQLETTKRGAAHLEARSGGSTGTGLTLRGGLITMQGDISIASSPDLTRRIADGYTFPALSEDISMFFADGSEEESSSYSRASSIIRLERLYNPEPKFTDTPYLPWNQ